MFIRYEATQDSGVYMKRATQDSSVYKIRGYTGFRRLYETRLHRIQVFIRYEATQDSGVYKIRGYTGFECL